GWGDCHRGRDALSCVRQVPCHPGGFRWEKPEPPRVRPSAARGAASAAPAGRIVLDTGRRQPRAGRHNFLTPRRAAPGPGPNRIAPTFDVPFTRLEHTRDGTFNLAYLRHTGQWWQVYQGLTLDGALKVILDDR